MRGNSTTDWGSTAKSLHWVVALLILCIVPVGFLMAATYGAVLKYADVRPVGIVLQQVHMTLGFTILALVVGRLIWRARNAVPAAPADQPAWQRGLGRLTHYGLYAVLLLFPLSGWASVSVFRGVPIWFFGWQFIPPILPALPLQHAYGYGFFARIHGLCWKVGAGLLALHLLAALWHHLVRRDGVLLRMWPGTSSRTLSESRATDAG